MLGHRGLVIFEGRVARGARFPPAARLSSKVPAGGAGVTLQGHARADGRPRGKYPPLADVRAALQELCRNRTGERPKCVAWVHEDTNGRRSDKDGCGD
ncbi:Imm1 family immunity protein [Streptomyces sp. NPDC127172]|uniref:Imm1 family immunity protein n=1 Tax=Streptomyces sp. NPDC127172 TaxID=3345382 RepID=UPI00363A566C